MMRFLITNANLHYFKFLHNWRSVQPNVSWHQVAYGATTPADDEEEEDDDGNDEEESNNE